MGLVLISSATGWGTELKGAARLAGQSCAVDGKAAFRGCSACGVRERWTVAADLVCCVLSRSVVSDSLPPRGL